MPRVSILEDLQLERDAIAGLLTAAGYQVAGAHGEPLGFLARVKTEAPEVAIIDVLLRRAPPGLDGLEVVRRLRARHPEVKCVVYSGLEDPALPDKSYAAGASAFLDKLTSSGEGLVQMVGAVSRGERSFPLGAGP